MEKHKNQNIFLKQTWLFILYITKLSKGALFNIKQRINGTTGFLNQIGDQIICSKFITKAVESQEFRSSHIYAYCSKYHNIEKICLHKFHSINYNRKGNLNSYTINVITGIHGYVRKILLKIWLYYTILLKLLPCF